MIRLSNAPRFLCPLLAVAAMALLGTRAEAQIATNITGVYNTGLTSGGGSLASGGTTDGNWSVSYASTNGGGSKNTTYMGSAYVITPAAVSASGYTSNTSNAQWIVAPGASTAATGGTTNTGGNYLPGNGTSNDEGVFIYTLAFTITGSGSAGTTVSSQIQITMTLAADDQYSVYVNPSGNGGSDPTGSAAATATSAWSNTTGITLQNYGTGSANNSTFKIGTNYIVVVVDNTNGLTGSQSQNPLNESGLLVYESAAATINGRPVPEVATWLPLAGSIGCYGLLVLRRRKAKLQAIRA